MIGLNYSLPLLLPLSFNLQIIKNNKDSINSVLPFDALANREVEESRTSTDVDLATLDGNHVNLLCKMMQRLVCRRICILHVYMALQNGIVYDQRNAPDCDRIWTIVCLCGIWAYMHAYARACSFPLKLYFHLDNTALLQQSYLGVTHLESLCHFSSYRFPPLCFSQANGRTSTFTLDNSFYPF